MGFDNSMAFRDCPWCGLTHGQMNVMAANAGTSPPNKAPRMFTLLACPACGGATVLETDAGQSGPGMVLEITPEGEQGVDVDHLPDDVAGYYADAVKVLRAGVPDAAAVQLRRTLEAAAAHYGVEERTLVKSIEKLIENGHVTKSFGRALHHIRQVGNQGAHHTDERVDEPTARRALRFTSVLLRDLFEVPAELDALESEAPAHDS